MRILQLTPGTGNFHCGSCLRDNTLVRALRARGHDVTMVPLYLPLVTDEPAETGNVPIFMSGLSVYLGRKFTLPGWLDRALSSPALLRLAAKMSGLTTAKDLGESAVGMLQGGHGEIERLIAWLRTQPPPDVISLSNSLLSALAGRLKQEFRVPIVSSFQGEDAFLNGLTEPYRSQSWQLLAERCADVNHFIAPSRYHADQMRARLALAADKITVVPNGLAIADFKPAPTPPATPTIGFLARMSHGKGLGTLADAFLLVKQKIPNAKLRVAGAQTHTDRPFVRQLQTKLGDSAEFLPNLDRAAKLEFLRSLNVLSVPATYGEAFGMYVLESLACAVPVVQPRHGAFPELIEATGGGLLCEPNDPRSLADALCELLLDPSRARHIGETGRVAVREKFSVETMTANIETIFQKVIHAP